MGLNKSTGNMYPFVNYTWNPIKGKCAHDCVYCYMKKWGLQRDVHLVEKEMQTDLYPNLETPYIFVGSSTDMFASDIPDEWIRRILDYCKDYPRNKYLFQSKNHLRLKSYVPFMPKNHMAAVTIESDLFHDGNRNNAPSIMNRLIDLREDRADFKRNGFMISIEPVMKFSMMFADKIIELKPSFVSIGADSRHFKPGEEHKKLNEPLRHEVMRFFMKLKHAGIEVFEKNNLKRITDEDLEKTPKLKLFEDKIKEAKKSLMAEVQNTEI